MNIQECIDNLREQLDKLEAQVNNFETKAEPITLEQQCNIARLEIALSIDASVARHKQEMQNEFTALRSNYIPVNIFVGSGGAGGSAHGSCIISSVGGAGGGGFILHRGF